MKRTQTHAGDSSVSMRISQEEKVRLVRLAQETNSSMSDLIRKPLAAVMAEASDGTIVRRMREPAVEACLVNIRIRTTEKNELRRLAQSSQWSLSGILQETLRRLLTEHGRA